MAVEFDSQFIAYAKGLVTDRWPIDFRDILAARVANVRCHVGNGCAYSSEVENTFLSNIVALRSNAPSNHWGLTDRNNES